MSDRARRVMALACVCAESAHWHRCGHRQRKRKEAGPRRRRCRRASTRSRLPPSPANSTSWAAACLASPGPIIVQYDPANDSWRTRAPLPRSLDHIGSVELNGKIYLIGGFVGGGVHRDGQNTAFEYDPASDTWRILAPMKAGRGFRWRGRARRQDPRHRRTLARQQRHGRDARGLRSGDQQLEGARAAAEGARSRRRGRDGRQDLFRGRPLRALHRSHRHARYLRSEEQHLDLRTGNADTAQRACGRGLQRRVHGARRRDASDRHQCRERSI